MVARSDRVCYLDKKMLVALFVVALFFVGTCVMHVVLVLTSSLNPGLVSGPGACLEHRNFVGITQKFHKNQFNFTEKTRE
jgi:hypothetical protein